jgi:hypothetical protein
LAKILAVKIKKNFPMGISREWFGFLEGRQIHEIIKVSQEGLHSMKRKKEMK